MNSLLRKNILSQPIHLHIPYPITEPVEYEFVIIEEDITPNQSTYIPYPITEPVTPILDSLPPLKCENTPVSVTLLT